MILSYIEKNLVMQMNLICGESRLLKKKNCDEVRIGVPSKVLWYLSPIPRLIQLYRNAHYAKNLTWHANNRIVDGKLRHPADSPAWKKIYLKWPEF